MSRTHVPPKAALNDGEAGTLVREALEDGSSLSRPGRTRSGGIWGWWLCQECNGKTSEWDEYYANFVKASVQLLEGAAPNPDVTHLIFEIEGGFQPGALVRSVLAGMFALSEDLATQYPNLAEATFEGIPGTWPEDLVLGLAINANGVTVASGQAALKAITKFRLRTQDSPVDGPERNTAFEAVPAPEVLIGSPPFLWFLGKAANRDEMPNALSAGSWIEDDPHAARAGSMELPVIAIVGESAKPGSLMFCYEDLINVRLADVYS